MFGSEVQLSDSLCFQFGCGSGLVRFGSVLALAPALVQLWFVSKLVLASGLTSGCRFYFFLFWLQLPVLILFWFGCGIGLVRFDSVHDLSPALLRSGFGFFPHWYWLKVQHLAVGSTI